MIMVPALAIPGSIIRYLLFPMSSLLSWLLCLFDHCILVAIILVRSVAPKKPCSHATLISFHHTTMQPSDIISALTEKFKNANESGERILFPSVVYEHQDIGLEVRSYSVLGFTVIISIFAELVSVATMHCVTEKTCGSECRGPTLPFLRFQRGSQKKPFRPPL